MIYFSLIFSAITIATVISQTKYCPNEPKQSLTCDPNSNYETFDGTCNNLNSPTLGTILSPYKRYLSPEYSDGINAPRAISVTQRRLPNPRFISQTLLFDKAQLENYFTHMVALFGQFVAFDLTHGLVPKMKCGCESTNPECFSIIIPPGDKTFKNRCLNFVRASAANQTAECNTGFREQINRLSSYLDLGQTYGLDATRNSDLRTFQKGLLHTSEGVTIRNYLPKDKITCGIGECFKAGENRPNENMGLASVYTLFLREHNRMATELSNLNPDWDDNKIFFETRRIMIALYQHIIYKEMLPAVVDQRYYQGERLAPIPDGYFEEYDPNVNPSISNEFATAAYRFGHSSIRNIYSRYSSDNRKIGDADLEGMLLNVKDAYNANLLGLESLMSGLFNDKLHKFGPNIADTLLNHMFESKSPPEPGQDLASININRGRDNGIPSYSHFRSFCDLPKVQRFDDLLGIMTSDSVDKLKSVYKNVDDIDLWVGGLFEEPSSRSNVVGPTFSCLIAKQFKDLKFGDRFYYENTPKQELNTLNTAFTPEQLSEVKSIKLASLICNNFDVKSIQPNVFYTEDVPFFDNRRVDCSLIPQINLSKWSKKGVEGSSKVEITQQTETASY